MHFDFSERVNLCSFCGNTHHHDHCPLCGHDRYVRMHPTRARLIMTDHIHKVPLHTTLDPAQLAARMGI